MIKPKDILQIDATILAGILILLTLAFSGNSNLLEELEKDTSERTALSEFTNTPMAWVYGVGFFVSLSAISAIVISIIVTLKKIDKKSQNLKVINTIPLVFMGMGFLVFLYGFIQIGLVLVNTDVK